MRGLGALEPRESCAAAAAALERGAAWTLELTAARLLRAIAGIGPQGARALCRRARVPHDAKLRDVDPRDRARLAALVRERARHGPTARTVAKGSARSGSAEQAHAALIEANRVRAARGALKRDLSACGSADALTRLAALVEDPPRDPALAQLTIGALLGAVRGRARPGAV